MSAHLTAGDWRVSPISGHLMSGHAVIALRPIDRMPEQEANFALLAVSKDLLAVAKLAVAWSARVPAPYRDWDFVIAARAAIAKAEGVK